MAETAADFKCFPFFPKKTTQNPLRSPPCWFFSLLNPSNRKNNAVSPHDDQVSMEVQAGHAVSKEEYNRVVGERNTFRKQLLQKDEEISKLQNQLRRIVVDLDSILSSSKAAVNLSHDHDKGKETAENTTVPVPPLHPRMQRDIIGATATPVNRSATLPPPPRSAEESPDSYDYIFDKIKKVKQVMKENESRLETAPTEPKIVAGMPNERLHPPVGGGGAVPKAPPRSVEEWDFPYTYYFERARKQKQVIQAKESEVETSPI